MTGADLVKLKNAGFRVFTKNIIKKTIHEKEYGVVKKHSGPYATKAELDRSWDDLMKDPKHVGL